MPGMARIFAIFLAALILLAAGGNAAPAADGRVPHPEIPKALKKTDPGHGPFMLKNHVKVLLRKRDETMRRGIRTSAFSLKGCLACHAVPGADNVPVSFDNPKHFCRVCHDFTAVKIKCFQCHSSKPPPAEILAAPVTEAPGR